MIEIYNIKGTVVYKGTNKRIELSTNPKGLYFVYLISNRGVTIHKLILM